MTAPTRYLRPAALGLIAMLGLALAGCAAPGAQPGGVAHTTQGDALDENLNGFLAQSPAGAVISLDESPWGENVEVIADERYFSASGRECRQLQVMSGSDSVRRAVACETDSGWESRRLITESTTAGRIR